MNKKTSLLAFGLLAVAALPSQAADMRPRMATKGPPPVVLQGGWTGCYVGANAGIGWAYKDWFDPQVGLNEGSSTGTGGAVGGQIGCDLQSGAFVFGLQGMIDWTNIETSHPYTDDPDYTDRSKVHGFATLTGRLGYLMQPMTLLYVKGGAAWVRDEFVEECSPLVDTCPAFAKQTRNGWTIGGGLEHRFTPNWSVFLEYNYMDFGRKRATLVYTDATTYDYDIRQDVQTVLFGINYRFGR